MVNGLLLEWSTIMVKRQQLFISLFSDGKQLYSIDDQSPCITAFTTLSLLLDMVVIVMVSFEHVITVM